MEKDHTSGASGVIPVMTWFGDISHECWTINEGFGNKHVRCNVVELK